MLFFFLLFYFAGSIVHEWRIQYQEYYLESLLLICMLQVNFNFEHAQKILFLIGYKGSNGKIFSIMPVQLFAFLCLKHHKQFLLFSLQFSILIYMWILKKEVYYVPGEVLC